MNYTIKDLQVEWFSKNFIYEALKYSLPFSKQFVGNKRFFIEKDLKILKYLKQFSFEKTVLKYWTLDKIDKNVNNQETVLQTVQPVLKNSPKTINDNIQKAVKEEIKTIKKQFENMEVELKHEIMQKDQIIKIKDEQTQKYALLKQEEKKEKDKWIGKYENIQNEKNELLKKFYSVKMYMMIFLILLILISLLILWFFVK